MDTFDEGNELAGGEENRKVDTVLGYYRKGTLSENQIACSLD